MISRYLQKKKNVKEQKNLIQTIRILSKNIEMEFGIEKCAMLIMKIVKRNNGRNKTAKSEKYQNSWRRRKLQVPGNIECRHHQTSRNKGKI